MDGVENKKCRQCEKFKPMTTEYYNRNNGLRDGFEINCKECTKHPENRKPRNKTFNDYIVNNNITTILIENEIGEILKCLVNTKHLQKLIDLNKYWHARFDDHSQTYYVRTNIYKHVKDVDTLLMHRFLTDAQSNDFVDHIDHDGLNNLDDNLRKTTNSKNLQHRKGANKNNGTGVRNVCYVERSNEYMVQIMKDGVRYKWAFPPTQFPEACAFAEKKRAELFGDFKGNG
jgi:hypothetical protein